MTRLTKEAFLLRAQKAHGDKYDYGKTVITKANQKSVITCSKHGDFKQSPSVHMRGHGCPGCSSEKNGKRKRVSKERFIKQVKEVYGDDVYSFHLLPEEYKGRRSKVRIWCNIHDKEFEKNAGKLVQGQGCPDCSKEKVEKRLSDERKKRRQEYIDRANERHENKYDYSKVPEEITCDDKITIICPQHGEFSNTTFKEHIGKGTGCQTCLAEKQSDLFRKPQEQFLKELSEIHGEKYEIISAEYKNAFDKIILRCSEHGNFEITPHAICSKNSGCPECGRVIAGEKSSKTKRELLPSYEEILNAFIEIHGNKYDYKEFKEDSYTILGDKITISCKQHGVFHQSITTHLSGSGCIICSGCQKKTKEQFIIEAIEIHGNTYDYSEVDYKSAHTKVVIKCKEHGKFMCRPNDHIYGRGCPTCKGSQFEILAFNTLKNLKLDFTRQFSFDDCCGDSGLCLRFDFGVMEDGKLLALIECDGDQHLTHIPHFMKDDAFNRQVRYDFRKNMYCSRNNIPFLRVHYSARYRLKKIIGSFLQDLKKGENVGTRCIPHERYLKFYTSHVFGTIIS